TADCASTTWQLCSRPSVITSSSSSTTWGFSAPPSSLRCLTVSLTVMATSRTAASVGVRADVPVALFDLGLVVARVGELEEVLAGDGRVLGLGGLLEDLVEAVVAEREL